MARILLVDDDTASLDLMRHALQQDGHEITTAESGADALERLKQNLSACDCLVTDVNMPGLNGIDLMLEASRLNPALSLVLISGFVDQLESAKTRLPGKVNTLAKPFTLEQIRAAVRSSL
ncbi:MAG: response regulator [Gammaproteobacteria bacterium]